MSRPPTNFVACDAFKDMQPDKIIHADGSVSDAELYEETLNDPAANQLADLFAMRVAVELGFTPKEAIEMCRRKFPLDCS